MASTNKYLKIKRASIILLLLMVGFTSYVIIANRNSPNMTIRQKLLNAIYPLTMWFTKATGTNTMALSNAAAMPAVPIYDLPLTGNDGKSIDLNNFKGKKILLVNTASDCGYTGQYAELEKLYSQHKGTLVVLGFPANDFKEQEKGTDKNIAEFCKANFRIGFPLLKKSRVIKGNGQNEIFQWLSDKNKNGWNDQAPTWNFCKYLVDENGRLINFFASSVDPMGKEIQAAIESP